MFQGGYGDFKGLTETYGVEEGYSILGRSQELPHSSQPEGKPSGTKFVETCEYPAKLEGPPSHLLQQIWTWRRTDTEGLILRLSVQLSDSLTPNCSLAKQSYLSTTSLFLSWLVLPHVCHLKRKLRDFLVAQWLGLCDPNAGGLGSVLSQELRTCYNEDQRSRCFSNYVQPNKCQPKN